MNNESCVIKILKPGKETLYLSFKSSF